jgi:hypothetical protein
VPTKLLRVLPTNRMSSFHAKNVNFVYDAELVIVSCSVSSVATSFLSETSASDFKVLVAVFARSLIQASEIRRE